MVEENKDMPRVSRQDYQTTSLASSTDEEDSKVSSVSAASTGNSHLNVPPAKKRKPRIVQMQSTIYKKPYRELGDFQHLHNFQVSEKPIWVVKIRQDGKYLATGGLDGVLRVYHLLPVYNPERNTATFFKTGSS